MNEILTLDPLQMSPYDETFPAKLLSQAFELRLKEANEVTDKVYKEIRKTHINEFSMLEPREEKMRLVVDASDAFMEDYKNGAVKLAYEKGNLVAQIKNNGKYGKKLPIKEEITKSGPNAMEVGNALQLKALQESIAEVSKQIQAIDESVKEVITGQQNDRLGLYYSGVSLYLEAMSIEDNDMKRELLAQSLKALTDSSFQLMLTLQSDVSYLKNKKYEKDKKNQHNLMNEKINNINQGFMAIHQASILKAGIYCQQGEMKALANVLQQYERFIKGTIVENANMLALCDINDDGTSEGTWKKREQLQFNVSKMVTQLRKPADVLYINSEGDNYESV